MGREWKPSPGDVALVRNEYGVWNVAIYAVRPADRGRIPFVWVYGVSDSTMPIGAEARPLVVIDPEDREQVERLAAAINHRHVYEPFPERVQAALRSLITPPKPEEPTGLGAVVEDAEGELWVRVRPHQGAFRQASGEHVGRYCIYDRIAAVRVLSEGVAP